MNKDNLIWVLKGLNYKFASVDGVEKTDRMVKAVGLSIHICFVNELRIGSYFTGANGEFLCWNSICIKDIMDSKDEDELARRISYNEEGLLYIHYLNQRPFRFYSKEELAERMLNI